MTTLIVPGWNGSGPHHWQSIWQRTHQYGLVEQRDWQNPDAAEWTAELARSVDGAEEDVFLIAHSLGCHTVARWAVDANAAARSKVRAAFLVAPPDLDNRRRLKLRGFQANLRERLPFPSLLVASETDQYMDLDDAQRLAFPGAVASSMPAARGTSMWIPDMETGHRARLCSRSSFAQLQKAGRPAMSSVRKQHLSMDWCAVIVSVRAAVLVRFGILPRVPW